MSKSSKTIKTLLGIGVALVSTVAVNMAPAMALIPDSQMAYRIESSRRFLQDKEQRLLKDIDNLNWDIHHTDSMDANSVYDMQRRLDQKYRDLNMVRLDIRDLNRSTL